MNLDGTYAKAVIAGATTSTTLDMKHHEFMNEFHNAENHVIPSLKAEREGLKEQLDVLRSNVDGTIEQIMEIKDRIREINATIRSLKARKRQYFLDNSKFVFLYFENKKNIHNQTTTGPGSGTASSATSSALSEDNSHSHKNKLVRSFFKLPEEVPVPAPAPASASSPAPDAPPPPLSNKLLVQRYMSNINGHFLDMSDYIKPTDVCQVCFNGELIPLDDEGVLICNICAANVPYLIENEKPSYKEPPKEVCFYAYKKINHFKEILSQFQGKETTQISDAVIQRIREQIRKEWLVLEDLTRKKTKEILKKLRLNKYYEHIAFIQRKLGIQTPVFSSELEETLHNLFIDIQVPYAKFRPDYRINFLNYYYVLFKFCELLGETQYLAEIPLLKDREKLIEQDETWKLICIELNWEYIPTV